MIAQLAVAAAVYAIDKPYSYRVPEGMQVQPGLRVLVPFGRGNRRSEAVVLALQDTAQRDLKVIERALDDAPILSQAQLQLAAFMKERYFCTFYEAVKAILPAGFWFAEKKTLTLAPGAQDKLPPGMANSDAARLVQLLQEFGGSAPERTLRQQFSSPQVFDTAVQQLLRRKLLRSDAELTQKTGVYTLYTLKIRYNGRALPAARLIDMKQELRAGNDLDLSRELEEGVRDAILDGKQSILFLNRRGNSRFLVCMDCGDVPQCPRCSVHLTYHSAGRRLMCHYCGYSEPAHARCAKCGGAMKAVGSGTQKVEQELKALFPDTAVLRMDADTVAASGGHEAMLRRFRDEQIPILLGTQMVAKGLDFPSVTLVGVLDADMSLYVDNFRAAETTFSLITQVVGRSGRGADSGCAMIQTMTPEHPVLQLAARQDYDAFYDMELQMRKLRSCPPFSDLFTITVAGLEERGLIQASVRLRDALAANLQREPYCREPAQLLGPAPAPVARVNYSYRYQLTLVCRNTAPIRRLLAFVLAEFSKDRQNRGLTALIDINSYN